MKPYIVAWTGASGIVYGVHTVRKMLEAGYSVALIISDAARLVLTEELGIQLQHPSRADHLREKFDWPASGDLQAFSIKDLTAPIASGSYPVEGMLICPCSMGSLGAIASGVTTNLIHRAADCILKESRKLVIVPRETPVHAGHLENMLKLSRMGARIVPAMPGFYSGAKTVEDLVDFMCGKVLDQMEIPNVLYPRWTGRTKGHPVE